MDAGIAEPYGRSVMSNVTYPSYRAISTVSVARSIERAYIPDLALNHGRAFVKERRTNVINGNRMSRLEARLIENDFSPRLASGAHCLAHKRAPP